MRSDRPARRSQTRRARQTGRRAAVWASLFGFAHIILLPLHVAVAHPHHEPVTGIPAVEAYLAGHDHSHADAPGHAHALPHDDLAGGMDGLLGSDLEHSSDHTHAHSQDVTPAPPSRRLLTLAVNPVGAVCHPVAAPPPLAAESRRRPGSDGDSPPPETLRRASVPCRAPPTC